MSMTDKPKFENVVKPRRRDEHVHHLQHELRLHATHAEGQVSEYHQHTTKKWEKYRTGFFKRTTASEDSMKKFEVYSRPFPPDLSR